MKDIIGAGTAVGIEGFAEMAAARKDGETVASLVQVRNIATTQGMTAKPSDAVRLKDGGIFRGAGNVPAWGRGAAAARALRAQEHLGDGHLSNERLAQLAGVSSEIIIKPTVGPAFSFALDEGPTSGRVVLRNTTWRTNRRFDLARLLGDRILGLGAEAFLPATRSQTYRQKWQRAFAAELLSPAKSLIDMVSGDVSNESLQAAAEHFEVAEMVVKTLLADNGLLDHDSIEASAEAA